MQMVKRFIPASLKLWYAVNKRRSRDFLNGNDKKFAIQGCAQNDLLPAFTIKQPVKSNESTVNKVHNLGLAIHKLNDTLIAPGRLFSFWQMVGNPSQKNGYKKSRSIVGNNLQEEVGGGLCQLSGLIYFLALHAGLTITERHAHSLDIYKEEERFTPLGSDATVAFGYKDLRLLNPYAFPVCFSFQLTPELLTGTIFAREKITACSIEFEYNKNRTETKVTTISKTNGNAVVIAQDSYGLNQAEKALE